MLDIEAVPPGKDQGREVALQLQREENFLTQGVRLGKDSWLTKAVGHHLIGCLYVAFATHSIAPCSFTVSCFLMSDTFSIIFSFERTLTVSIFFLYAAFAVALGFTPRYRFIKQARVWPSAMQTLSSFGKAHSEIFWSLVMPLLKVLR
jgi:hypothetical protein